MKKLFAFFFLFSNILGQNFNNLLINDLILDNEKIFVVGRTYDNSLQVVRTQINDTSQTIIFKKSYLAPDTVVVAATKTLLSDDTLIVPYILFTKTQENFIMHLKKDGTVIKNNRMPFPIMLFKYLDKPILITYNTTLKIYSYPELNLLKSFPDINVDLTTLDPNSDFNKMIIYDDGKINSRIIVINNFNDSLKIFKFSNRDFRLKGYYEYENERMFVASSSMDSDAVYVNLYSLSIHSDSITILKKKKRIIRDFIMDVLKIDNLFYILVDQYYRTKLSYLLIVNENLEILNQIPIKGSGIKMTNSNNTLYIAVNVPTSYAVNSFIQRIPISSTTNVEEKTEKITFQLYQNYPNPFNTATRIRYSVKETRPVMIKLYDIVGREVATLVNEVKDAGNYEIEVDGEKLGLSTGIYFYQMKAGKFTATNKMVFLK